MYDTIFPHGILWWHLIIAYFLGYYTLRPLKRMFIRIIFYSGRGISSGASYLTSNRSSVKMGSVSDVADKIESKEPLKPSYTSKSAPIVDKLDNLTRRLNKLRGRVNQFNLEQCKSELEKCKAFIENVKDMMAAQGVSMMDVFMEFQRVRELIIDIDFEIAKKDNVWWRRLKRLISTILDLVSMKLLGPGGL